MYIYNIIAWPNIVPKTEMGKFKCFQKNRNEDVQILLKKTEMRKFKYYQKNRNEELQIYLWQMKMFTISIDMCCLYAILHAIEN